MYQWSVNFLFVFLIWSLYAYGMHVLAHYNPRRNPLFKIHKAHHLIKYHQLNKPSLPTWQNYLLWFGGLRESLDVWLTLILPALILALLLPSTGGVLLLLVYLYEVFLSETVLDHNPKIGGILQPYLLGGNTT